MTFRKLVTTIAAISMAGAAFAFPKTAKKPMAPKMVHGYTRTMKSGKKVMVHGYTRNPAPKPEPKMVHVKGYTKTLKSGKKVVVKGYTRKGPAKRSKM